LPQEYRVMKNVNEQTMWRKKKKFRQMAAKLKAAKIASLNA